MTETTTSAVRFCRESPSDWRRIILLWGTSVLRPSRRTLLRHTTLTNCDLYLWQIDRNFVLKYLHEGRKAVGCQGQLCFSIILYHSHAFSCNTFLAVTHCNFHVSPLQSGADFDQCVTHVLERKLEGSIVALEDAESAISCDFAAPTCAVHNLYPLSEGLRRLLTDGHIAALECMTLSKEARRRNLRSSDSETGTPSFSVEDPKAVTGNRGSRDILTSEGGEHERCELWKPFRLELTRAEYEHSCASLFDRGVAPVDRLLDYLDLRVDEIDEVVMVGGMTRTPRVRNLLKSHLGVDRLNVDIDPDVVVAYGAATIAH